MLEWLKRKLGKPEVPPELEPEPPRIGENPDNPGYLVRGSVAFWHEERKWDESIDLPAALAQAMRERGHSVLVNDDVVLEEAMGFVLRPLFASGELKAPSSARISTTIEFKHPVLTQRAIFDYQHTIGESANQALAEGFAQWCDTDFVALQEAARESANECLDINMTAGERERRITFGPVYFTKPGLMDEESDFCPCCLFTKSGDALTSLAEREGFLAIRLFASRGADGEIDADCRINGVDYPEGIEALKAYVRTWPDAGFEYRKQYVIIQDSRRT
jgi:hypothetical protein